MVEKLIIAGAGGQGVMLLGKVLATAAMQSAKHVTWLPAYGAEVRGGTAYCMVIISDNEIGSPHISQADSLIILNSPSLNKFRARLSNKGVLIGNSSMIEEGIKAIAKKFFYPFTDIAIKLGNIKVANIVALGCYLAKRPTVTMPAVIKAIKEIAPSDKKELIEINIKALKEGARLN